jgi:hypothetical protein
VQRKEDKASQAPKDVLNHDDSDQCQLGDQCDNLDGPMTMMDALAKVHNEEICWTYNILRASS